MLHSTPNWLQSIQIQRLRVHKLRVQKHRWWRPLLWAGLLALTSLLAWQMATSGALLAADAIALNSEWRFVDESKPGAPMAVGALTSVSADAPAEVAARFDISSTMQALALQLDKSDLGGLSLAEVEELGYCTRLVDGPRPYAVTLQINLDADVTDNDQSWQGRLVYTPSYNGAVIQGEWQCWNTLVGKWWATGGPVAEYAPVDNPQPLGTLLAHFPHLGVNATYSVVALKAGDGWHDFLGEASPVVIGVAGENLDIAFGTAPQDDAPLDNAILLPVLFNEPQVAPQDATDDNKDQDKKADKKAKKAQEDKDKKDQPDEQKEQASRDPGRTGDWANLDWSDVDWEDFDWEKIDWEKVDWEHLDWAAFGWRDVSEDALRAFVEDVKGCKKRGWQDEGFKNQGQCVAYYVAAHSPLMPGWDHGDWDNGGWRRTWNRDDDRENYRDNDRDDNRNDDHDDDHDDWDHRDDDD